MASVEWRTSNSWRAVHRAVAPLACALAALCCHVPAARALTANWTNSNLDLFSYNEATSPGTRAFGPTFLGGITVNQQTQQFEPETVDDPARLGNTLIAFNTSSQITNGLAANRYILNSVTVEATWTYDGDPVKLEYENQPVSQSQMLAEAISGNFSRRRPMELYGVGMREGYTGYEFASPTPGPPLLDELTHPYSASDEGYIAYPIVGHATDPGTYVDVSNSVTGGYSATDVLDHLTDPFTPTPWAIGTTNLSPGDEFLDAYTTMSFALDLNAPGVRSYVQRSLATGALGFFLSSLHSTGQEGSGGGYPKWYLKEAMGFPYFIPLDRMPKLTIDYTIRPPLAGDYDGNGSVDAADYILWRNSGPLDNQLHDPMNVTPQDYTEWRARFGNALGSGGMAVGAEVPEPDAASLAFAGLALIGNIGRRRIGT